MSSQHSTSLDHLWTWAPNKQKLLLERLVRAVNLLSGAQTGRQPPLLGLLAPWGRGPACVVAHFRLSTPPRASRLVWKRFPGKQRWPGCAMEPRVVKPPGQDLAVERLKSRYGLGGPFLAEVRARAPLEAMRHRAEAPGFGQVRGNSGAILLWGFRKKAWHESFSISVGGFCRAKCDALSLLTTFLNFYVEPPGEFKK